MVIRLFSAMAISACLSWLGVGCDRGGAASSTGSFVPFSGSSTSPTKSPASSIGKRIFVGTNVTGLFISDDEGKNWQNKKGEKDGLKGDGVYNFFEAEGRLYAVTYNGVSVSTDEGSTWKTDAISGLVGKLVWRVVIDGEHIYAATTDGVAVSTDGGKTFQTKNTKDGLGGRDIFDICKADGRLFAATEHGISISSDNGNTWKTITVASNKGLISDDIEKITAVKGSIYASTRNGLSVSDDHGESWRTLIRDTYVNMVFIDGSSIYAASGDGLYISSDGGQNWQLNKKIQWKSGGQFARSGNSIRTILANENKIYAGTENGLFVSSDGGAAWQTLLVKDPPTLPVYDVNTIFILPKKSK